MSELKNKLREKAGRNLPTEQAKPRTMEDEVKGFLAKYGGLLPSSITQDRMRALIITELMKLRDCTPQSFYAAMLRALKLGLEPGVVNQCFLLPFKNNKTNQKEVQFIIGYGGMIDLALRTGRIKSMMARPKYEGDSLTISYGLDTEFKHVPYHQIKGAVKGKLEGVTLVVLFTNGGSLTDYMPICEIEEHRARSRAKDSGPWVTDYEAMCLKTIVRKNFRWLPISVEVQSAITSADERVSRLEDDGTITDVDYEILAGTGEAPMSEEEKARIIQQEQEEAQAQEGISSP